MVYAGHVGAVGQPILPLGNSGPSLNRNFTTGSTPSNSSRASAANYWNSAGVRTAAGNNVARMDYDPQTLALRGLLVEEQRTNFLLNSLTPVTQDVSLGTGTFTLWMEGSGSVTSAAGTAVGTGFGSATNATGLGTYGTPNTITITTAGTVTITVTGTVTAFQLENGAYPTSMITTTGASATRAADVMGDTLTGFNPTEGTLLVTAIPTHNVSLGTIVQIDAGNNNNCHALKHRATATQEAYTTTTGGSTVNILQSPLPTVMQSYTMAGAYKSGDFAFTQNGATPTTGTSTALPTGIVNVRYGSRGPDQFFNGWIQKVSYYNTRLSNSDLQSVTAPAPVVAPRIAYSGGGYTGSTYTAYDAIWSGNALLTHAYQWYANGVAIPGQTTKTFVMTNALEGAAISFTDVGTGGAQPVTATSNTIDLFVPSDIGGMAVWYDVSDASTVTKDGSNLIAQINDKSGNANHAVQATAANKPTWTANEINGLPTAVFTDTGTAGTSGRMLSQAAFSTTDCTIAVVMRRGAITGTFEGYMGGTCIGNLYSDTSMNWARSGTTDGVGAIRSVMIPIQDQYYCHTMRCSPSQNNIEMRENFAILKKTTYSAGATTASQMRIGYDGNNNYANVSIGEIIVFPTYLTDAQLLSVENYLNDKWRAYTNFAGRRTQLDVGTQRYATKNNLTSISGITFADGLIALGQSNNMGVAPISGLPAPLTGPQTNRFIWNNSAGQWQTLEAGVNNLPNSAGQPWHGPEMTVCSTIYGSTGRPLYYFKYGQGGTSISQFWNVGLALYNGAIAQYAAASYQIGFNSGIQIVPLGLLWYQGEADTTAAFAPSYQQSENAIFTNWREGNLFFGLAGKKIVDVSINNTTYDQYYVQVNAAKDTNAGLLPKITRIAGWTGTDTVDGIHANSPAQQTIGTNAANVFLAP